MMARFSTFVSPEDLIILLSNVSAMFFFTFMARYSRLFVHGLA